MKPTFLILFTFIICFFCTGAILIFVRLASINPTLNTLVPDHGEWLPLQTGKLYQQTIPLLADADHIDLLLQTEASKSGQLDIKINNGQQTVSSHISTAQIIDIPQMTIALPSSFIEESNILTITLIPDTSNAFSINLIKKEAIPTFISTQITTTVSPDQFMQIRSANNHNQEIKLLSEVTVTTFYNWSRILINQYLLWQHLTITIAGSMSMLAATLIYKTILQYTKLPVINFFLMIIGIIALSFIF